GRCASTRRSPSGTAPAARTMPPISVASSHKAAILAGSTLLTLLLGTATWLDPVPLGLLIDHRPDADAATATGAVCPIRGGTYLFAAGADGPAEIVIDGEPVRGPLRLDAGAHAVMLRYTHPIDRARLNFLWARNGDALSPVPSWALRPHKIRSLPRLRARVALDRALALSEWVWVGLLVLRS